MGKTLLIAEKPSVASDIAAALGGMRKVGSVFEREDLIVTNALGHLVELEVVEPEGGRGFDSLPVLPPEFGLKVIDKTRDQFKVVQEQLRRKDVTTVMNACDAGREGEHIFRLIMAKTGCTKPIKRMWCQSMTAASLTEAFLAARPGEEFDAMADAARCRAEADWLIGINGSRALTGLRQHQTGKYEGTNAGRVQTPTLAIVVDRENEIANFVPQDFWEVIGTFGVAAGTYTGKWRPTEGAPASAEGDDDAAKAAQEEAVSNASRFADRAAAMELVQRLQGKPVDSVEETVTPTRQLPPRLFDLTTLQREANKRFKLPVKKTLDIAQSLYERHKMTTYPRTDASALPEDYVESVKTVITQLEDSPFGRFAKQITDADWVDAKNKRVFDNSKISDHFAIIPTGVQSSGLSADEEKVYELIVRRFLAAFFPAAEFNKTTRVTVVDAERFHSGGKVMTFAGWTSVLRDEPEEGAPKDAEGGLCSLQEGERPTNEGIEARAGRTTPPGRFTEASLLAAMETAGRDIDDEELRAAMKDKGIGTPATRASMIEGLLNDRDGKGQPKEPYIRREKNNLVPTPKGMGLIALLRSCGVSFLASAQTTGEWEERLNRMSKGEYDRATFMAEIRDTTSNMVDVLRAELGKTPPAAAPVTSSVLQVRCPSCRAAPVKAGRMFECDAGCGWKIWRDVAQRTTTDEEFARLANGETLTGLSGFYSTTKKRNFSAGLKLGEDLKLAFVFDDAPAGPREPGGAPRGKPDKALACTCPKCDGWMASKPALVECVDCGWKIWREIAEKKLTDNQLDQLIQKGSIKNLNGFVSKRSGNVFAAGLKLDRDTGKTEFVFEDRK